MFWVVHGVEKQYVATLFIVDIPTWPVLHTQDIYSIDYNSKPQQYCGNQLWKRIIITESPIEMKIGQFRKDVIQFRGIYISLSL